MRMINTVIVASLVLGASLALASSPFASSDEPHGIVDLDIAAPAKQIFEGFFLEVDGTNIVSGRQQLLLRPGKHQIKIGAKMDSYARGLSTTSNRSKAENVVEIDIKEGVRYSVAAKVDGEKSEWKAIVTRENPIAQ